MKMLVMLVTSCLFITCRPATNVAPAGLLSKNRMIDLLTDIQLAEAGASHTYNLHQLNAFMAERYAAILAKHKVSYEQFVASYDYYLHHPAQLAAIYDEVIIRLTAMEAAIRNSGNYQPAPVSPPRQQP